MKKIPVTLQVAFPETLEEAIKIFGIDRVFRDYLAMLEIVTLQKMRAASKIEIVY